MQSRWLLADLLMEVGRRDLAIACDTQAFWDLQALKWLDKRYDATHITIQTQRFTVRQANKLRIERPNVLLVAVEPVHDPLADITIVKPTARELATLGMIYQA